MSNCENIHFIDLSMLEYKRALELKKQKEASFWRKLFKFIF